jgi:DNA invertase Pin-like site-specific DNA recombinase
MKTTGNAGKFVSYLRVSTQRQGASGLGLEAQRKAVMDYLNGGRWVLLGEFVEIESGRKADRPELRRAMELCKAEGATLVIARLDRLARNVHFISGLMESGVEFVAVDNPHATRLILHVMAAFAEEEARQIRARTKAAIAAARARGVEWGKFGKVLARQNAEAAKARAVELAPAVAEIRAAGIVTVRGIAEELNRRGIPSPRGARWHVPAVFRLLKRIGGRRRVRRSRRAVARKAGARAPRASRRPSGSAARR